MSMRAGALRVIFATEADDGRSGGPNWGEAGADETRRTVVSFLLDPVELR